MILKSTYRFLVLLLFSQSLTAQVDNAFFFGKLKDADSGEPIVFATIQVKNASLGVISNKDGGFKIPFGFTLKGEAIEVSCIGYLTKTVRFTELITGALNTILLVPSTIELNETIVTSNRKDKLTSKKIVRYALDRISQDYDNEPFGLVGYYRDYQLQQEEYLNLNEALIGVFDQGFKNADYNSTQFAMYDYVPRSDFKVDSFAAKPYDFITGDKYIPDATLNTDSAVNELVLLFLHDVIRNHKVEAYSYVYTLVDDFMKEHRFLDFETTSFDTQGVYKIKFKKKDLPFKIEGTIYIDQHSYAIRKLDYAAFKQKRIDGTSPRYSAKDPELLYEILVEYKEHESKMYLNYISFHNLFTLVRQPEFFIEGGVVNRFRGELKVFLNRPASNWPDRFKVFFKNKPMAIVGIRKLDSSTLVFTFSQKNSQQQRDLDLFFSKVENDEEALRHIRINTLFDYKGNYLGERESQVFDQFREFFTQKVLLQPPFQKKDAKMVVKSKPLGDGDQPITNLALGDEFWMNTPLKGKQ